MILLVVVVAVGVFLFFPSGDTLSVANAATLAVLSGDVEAQKGGRDFAPALDGELLASGDVVRSNQQGRATVTFFDGSTLSVEPGSQVKVVSLARTAGDGLQVTIEQTLGRTWASVQKLKTADSRFEVKTPTSTAVVRGSAFLTIVAVIAGVVVTTVKTTEGVIVVQAVAGGQTTVPAGTEVTQQQNQPAPPAPVQSPPTPTLTFTAAANVGYLVQDPRGYKCGPLGVIAQRTIPRCDVQGSSVTIDDVVSGPYSLTLTAAAAVADAAIVATGRRGATTDFAQRFSVPLALGDLVRTSFNVTVGAAGVLAGAAFAPADRITSVCGAEARGRVFSAGPLADRQNALNAYARDNRNQPASIVITGSELTTVAAEGTAGFRGPATISNIAVTIDGAGLHLSGQATAGPITVPARADIIAGASGGRLVLRLARLDLGPIPGPVRDQLVAAVERPLNEFVNEFPLVVARVAFRTAHSTAEPGCMAIIGTTRP